MKFFLFSLFSLFLLVPEDAAAQGSSSCECRLHVISTTGSGPFFLNAEDSSGNTLTSGTVQQGSILPFTVTGAPTSIKIRWGTNGSTMSFELVDCTYQDYLNVSEPVGDLGEDIQNITCSSGGSPN